MADAGLWKTVVDAVVEAAFKYGIPAAGGVVLGGGGAAAIARLIPRSPLNNSDFRIKAEQTSVSIEADPASAQHARVRVRRAFTLKLRDDKKKGRYRIDIDLSQTQGKWEKDCAVTLDESRKLEVAFDNEDSVIKASTPRLTRRHTLNVILHSVERISKARRFYALVVGNPKDLTKFHWTVDSSANGVHGVARAFASSEDFDLLMLEPGGERNVHESTHQVTYFITW